MALPRQGGQTLELAAHDAWAQVLSMEQCDTPHQTVWLRLAHQDAAR